eukprot:GHVL01006175.1.p1 GENE.GHVL01006175.1~~GHVL01006175.1.p1  ORF type:complete len:574 (+),score=87.75 GHVL01006175.1:69-1724(+)
MVSQGILSGHQRTVQHPVYGVQCGQHDANPRRGSHACNPRGNQIRASPILFGPPKTNQISPNRCAPVWAPVLNGRPPMSPSCCRVTLSGREETVIQGSGWPQHRSPLHNQPIGNSMSSTSVCQGGNLRESLSGPSIGQPETQNTIYMSSARRRDVLYSPIMTCVYNPMTPSGVMIGSPENKECGKVSNILYTQSYRNSSICVPSQSISKLEYASSNTPDEGRVFNLTLGPIRQHSPRMSEEGDHTSRLSNVLNRENHSMHEVFLEPRSIVSDPLVPGPTDDMLEKEEVKQVESPDWSHVYIATPSLTASSEDLITESSDYNLSLRDQGLSSSSPLMAPPPPSSQDNAFDNSGKNDLTAVWKELGDLRAELSCMRSEHNDAVEKLKQSETLVHHERKVNSTLMQALLGRQQTPVLGVIELQSLRSPDKCSRSINEVSPHRETDVILTKETHLPDWTVRGAPPPPPSMSSQPPMSPQPSMSPQLSMFHPPPISPPPSISVYSSCLINSPTSSPEEPHKSLSLRTKEPNSRGLTMMSGIKAANDILSKNGLELH